MSLRSLCAGAQRQTHQIPDEAQAWSVAADAERTIVALAEAGEFAFELPRFNQLSRAVTDAIREIITAKARRGGPSKMVIPRRIELLLAR